MARASRRLPVVATTRGRHDSRLTGDDAVVFRDPPARAPALRLELARILVGAPRLPIDLPAFAMTLVDVEADRDAIDLVFGAPDAFARLRIRFVDDAPGIELVGDPRSHLRPLELARSRLLVAINRAKWDVARPVADELMRQPRDVPLSFLRQLVAGVTATAIVRVGFQCNQDCGMCWQGRDWGKYDRAAVLTWIEDLFNAGARALIVSGGEPMMDPHLCEYVERAQSLGIGQVTLETNAVLAERGDIAPRLRRAGVTNAFVSLHSADAAVSDAITRAPGTHARTVRGIRAFLDAGIAVKLNAVLTAQGLSELAALPEFIARTFGALPLMISYPSSPFDQGLQRSILPSPADLRRALLTTIERAVEVGVPLEGLDGPCGPPLCTFAADPRVTKRAAIPAAVPFRRQVAQCEGCVVRHACFGVHESEISLYGEGGVTPIQ